MRARAAIRFGIAKRPASVIRPARYCWLRWALHPSRSGALTSCWARFEVGSTLLERQWAMRLDKLVLEPCGNFAGSYT